MEKFLKIHPEYKQLNKTAIQSLKKGESSDKVGDIVFQAIKNNIFYILTDTHHIWKKSVKNRMDGILNAYEENKLMHK